MTLDDNREPEDDIPLEIQKIPRFARSSEVIKERIKYLNNSIPKKMDERTLEYEKHGITDHYRTLSSRMTNIRCEIRLWKYRLEVMKSYENKK